MSAQQPNVAAGKIFFMSKQINLNTWYRKIIPYNQEKNANENDALFL